jgi:hypothetical protein
VRAIAQDLGVGGTGKRALDGQHHLTGSGIRDGDVLQTEVAGAMKYQGTHDDRRYQHRACAMPVGTLRPDE